MRVYVLLEREKKELIKFGNIFFSLPLIRQRQLYAVLQKQKAPPDHKIQSYMSRFYETLEATKAVENYLHGKTVEDIE